MRKNKENRVWIELVDELVDIVESAITSGDWIVDGCADPCELLDRANRLLGNNKGCVTCFDQGVNNG
jgi:hypothetical protein